MLDQNIIGYSGDRRSEWCAQAHFVEKPNRTLLALRLVVDFLYINSCPIRDQAQLFPTGEEIRQQLDPECCCLAIADALSAYYQIDVAELTQVNVYVEPRPFNF